MTFGDQTAELSKVHSALLAFGGKNDNLVTANAVRPIMGTCRQQR